MNVSLWKPRSQPRSSSPAHQTSSQACHVRFLNYIYNTAKGKVKSETRRDAETLVWKSETETRKFQQNPSPRLCTKKTALAWDYISRKSGPVSKTVRSKTWATRYSKINEYKIDKSRVPKCYAMTTNLRQKNPDLSRLHIRKTAIVHF